MPDNTLPQLRCDQPVKTLRDQPADYETISAHFDRYSEYGLIVAKTEAGIRKAIDEFSRPMYCGKGDLGAPYRLGDLFYMTYRKYRSCD